jgi:hypothetical protein
MSTPHGASHALTHQGHPITQLAGNPTRLAEAQTALGLPGRRSKTAITRLRAQRRQAGSPPPATTLRDRLERRLLERYTQEITRRGGETTIWGGDRGDRPVNLRIADRPTTPTAAGRGLVLLGCEGWRRYSRGYGYRWASLAYLCGMDDNGPWAARVPGTTASVAEALAYLEPADVRHARANGRRVLRQGDIYAVQTSPAHDTRRAVVIGRHRWDPETRTLIHDDSDRPHAALPVPFPVRFIQQRPLGMGRLASGRRTGPGDWFNRRARRILPGVTPAGHTSVQARCLFRGGTLSWRTRSSGPNTPAPRTAAATGGRGPRPSAARPAAGGSQTGPPSANSSPTAQPPRVKHDGHP